MSKVSFSFLLLFSLFLLSSGTTISSNNALAKRVQKKVSKEIKSIFAVEDFDLLDSKIEIPYSPFLVGQKMNEIRIGDELLGYAFLGTAPSKTDTFEYLILFDESFTIKKTTVLFIEKTMEVKLPVNDGSLNLSKNSKVKPLFLEITSAQSRALLFLSNP